MDSSREVDIGEDVEFPEKSLMEEESRNIDEEESVLETMVELKQDEHDTVNLSVSLAILDVETEVVDAEFYQALKEIEGKNSFPSPKCAKVCKSKSGLTRHTNSKHREVTVNVASESDNCLSLENLAGIVDSIKNRFGC